MQLPSGLTAVEDLIRARLAQPLPGSAAQRRFAPDPTRRGWSPDQVPGDARRAAALVLLYPHEDAGVALPLTVRHPDLPHHPGQVSLPGGAIDPGETPAQAALREAEEEIGVSAGDVRLLGPLSTLWVPVSNFVIHPFVGTIAHLPIFRPHAAEVGSLLEVPFAHLVDRSRLKWTSRERNGTPVSYPYFDLAGEIVWGATAMILGELACLIEPEHAPPGRTD